MGWLLPLVNLILFIIIFGPKPINEFMERHIRWLRWQVGRRRHSSQSSILHRIPPELIREIADWLPLYSQVLLSHTCSDMYSQLHEHCLCAISKLTREERVNYLAGRACAFPDVWACENCTKLHRVYMYDTPSHPMTACSRPQSRMQVSGETGDYALQHRHVQMALKLARLDIQKSYLRRLMKPYKFTNKSSSDVFTFTASPVISNGRFLLYSTWRYRQRAYAIAFERALILHPCPHLRYWPYPNLGVTPLVALVYKAMGQTGQDADGACQRCPSDCSVRVMGGERKEIVVKVWQDLGPETSPLDLSWKCLLYKHGPQREEWDSPDFGPPIWHEPGTVREAYEKAIK